MPRARLGDCRRSAGGNHHGRSHPRVRARTCEATRRTDAAQLADDYVELLTPLLTVTPADLRTGPALFERNETLGTFDAVLAAAAVGSSATLVSADAAFASIAELPHMVPDANGVRDLLRNAPDQCPTAATLRHTRFRTTNMSHGP